MTQTALEMRKITKMFGDFVANKEIDFNLKKGEIHALLGENGAGKSTLVSMLSGLLQPTAGEIAVDGQIVQIDSPQTASKLGIGMVYQHFMLIDQFSVAENIMLGNEISQAGVLNKKESQQTIQKLSEDFNLRVDPTRLVKDLSVGQQQRVEILKTLYRKAQIIILDEPTAVLTPQEIDGLIQSMKDLAAAGKSIIFISHKLDEIMQAADRVTVIRRGEKIATVDTCDLDPKQLAEMMVGHQVNFRVDKAKKEVGRTILSLDRLSVCDNRALPATQDISFDLHAGEILGLAGIDGNGQAELIEAIAGLRQVESGQIWLDGKDVTQAQPRQMVEQQMAYIPEDRQERGLELEMSVADNLIFRSYYQPPFSKAGVFNFDAITDYGRKLVDEFDIRTTGIDALAGSLSGGNQQKIILGRELDRDPELLVACQPTRGLDVGAIELVHQRIMDQRNKGKAVLLVSSELDEILDLSDRIAVIHDGRIIGIVPADQTDKQDLGLMMVGQKTQGERKERV